MSPSQQAALSQAQLHKLALSQQAAQSYQGLMGAYAPAKEDPKNAFMERVRKIYVKRIELRIRLTMGIGGLIMFILGPLIGYQVFRFWYWIGMPEVVRELGGFTVGFFLMILAVTSIVMSLDGGVAHRWARDWVDEQEGK